MVEGDIANNRGSESAAGLVGVGGKFQKSVKVARRLDGLGNSLSYRKRSDVVSTRIENQRTY